MATATFYIENNSAYSFVQASDFQSWTKFYNGVITQGYSTPNDVYMYKTFGTSTIVSGSTINSAYLYATVDKGTYGGTSKQNLSTTLAALDVKALIVAGSNTNIRYNWKSSTGGSYPSAPSYNSTNYLDKTGRCTWTALSLVVDYTLPYSACGAPTYISVPTNVAPSSVQNISWSGASAGTNNAITGYAIYCSSDGYASPIATSTAENVNVTAPATNGAAYTYIIVTVGTVAGYNSAGSTASSAMTCSFTAPAVPAGVAISSQHVSGGNVTLSWNAAAGGTNNPIAYYYITGGPTTYTTTSTSIAVPSAAAGSGYTYNVYSIGTHSNSAASAGVSVWTYTNPTAPSATPSLSATTVDAGGTVTLTWVDGAAGYDNAITGYDVYRRINSGASTLLGSTSAAVKTLSVTTTGSAMGDKYYYRVLTKGTYTNSAFTAETSALTVNTYTQVGTPTSVKIGGTTALYVLAGSAAQDLTWVSGGNGTGTTVNGYEIWRDGAKLTNDTASPYSAAIHATAGNSYTYAVRAESSPVGYTSNLSASATVYTYSNPTPPTTLTGTPYNGTPGLAVTLSWSGAANGSAYNPIQTYSVMRKIGSGVYGAIATIPGTTYEVMSPTTNGTSHSYQIIANGSLSSSAQSTETLTLTCSVTAPSIPLNVKVDGAISTYVTGGNVDLTWEAGTQGTNNPIVGYQVYQGGVVYGAQTAAVTRLMSVPSHSTNGNSYSYTVKTVGTYAGYTLSNASNGAIVYTHSKPTAPTTIAGTNASATSGANYTITWSGHNAGSGTITFELWRSVSGGAYALLEDNIPSTVTSKTVSAHASNAGYHTYAVKCISDLTSSYDTALSAATATITTVFAAPIAPNSITVPTDVVPNSQIQISWAGASGGTNNPITAYNIYSSADNYATAIANVPTSATSSSAYVTSHTTNGSSLTFKIETVGTYGGLKTKSAVSSAMTSTVGAITAPTLVQITNSSNIVVTSGVAPSTAMKVAWSGQSGGVNNTITGFNVYESINAGSTWTKLTATPVTVSPYSPVTSSASNNASKMYKVEAVAERLSNAESASKPTLTTTVTKPSAPASISINDPVDVLWGAQRTLTWSVAAPGTNNPIAKYRIMRSVDGATAVQLGTDITNTTTSGTLQIYAKDLANGTHTYTIHTIGSTPITAEQVSAVSTAFATLTSTVTNPTAPTASIPTNVVPGSVQSLSWSGAANGKNNDITTYQIYESVDGGAWTNIATDGTSPYGAITASAANGGNKSYKIITDGPRGDSAYSNTVTMTTTVGAPKAPTSLSLSDTANIPPNTDVTLSWLGADIGVNNPIKGYRVLLSVDGGSYAQTGSDILSAGVTTGSTSVTSKNGIGTHTYKVMTLGNVMSVNSLESTATVTLTSVVGAPNPPTSVSVADGNGVAPSAVRRLSWSGATGGTNNTIKGYQVYRYLNGAGETLLADNVNVLYLDVTALGVDGTYTYKVVTMGNTLSVNSLKSSSYGTLTTGRVASTGALDKPIVVATGSDNLTVTITTQTGTSYSHKVTWYIPSTSYTSGVLSLTVGDLSDTFTLPQTWIGATTKTTSSIAAKCKVETFDGAESIGINEYSFTVTVPPASTFVLNKASLTATGSESIQATITTGYSAYTHKVTWYASTTPLREYINNVAASATPVDAQTIAKNWCDAIPNATSISATCTVETLKVTTDGTMSLGATSKTFVVYVPSDVIPTVTSLTPAQIEAYWGLYVKTKSKCKLSPVASGSYSSTITSYRIVSISQDSGSQPYSAGCYWTSDYLTASGTIQFDITVTDSRGRTNTGNTSIAVTNYSPPTISGTVFDRALVTGVIDRKVGTYINAYAVFTYSAIGSNAITAKIYYRQTGTTDWLPSVGVSIASAAITTFGSGAIATSFTYQTRIVLTDSFGSVEHLGSVSTIVRAFDMRETRTAFGRIATYDNELSVPENWDFVKGTTKVSYEGHAHTKANITDFPASMPASDVSAWAKAASKPTYLNTEVGAAATVHAHGTYDRATSALIGATVFSDVVIVDGIITNTTTRAATAADFGAAATEHMHVKENITDFPTSLPASDVSAWAKAATKPTYIPTEVGAAPAESTTLTNKLKNSDWSLGLRAEWGVEEDTGNITLSSDHLFDSKKTLKMSIAASGWMGYVYQSYYFSQLSVSAESYVLSFYYRTDAASLAALGASDFAAQIGWWNQYNNLPIGTTYDVLGSELSVSTEWQRYVKQFTVPAGSLGIYVCLGTYAFPTDPILMYYANPQLEKGSVATPWSSPLFAAESHGSHVPQSAYWDGTVFLGSNGQWQVVWPETIGAANIEHEHLKANITDFAHTHVKANITDFPASMPASDVSAWAKAGTKPTYTNSEVGAAATSHPHGNITNAGAIGAAATLPIITTTSGVLTTGTFGIAAGSFCQGNDGRLSDSRIASDVSAWAKAGTKPTYTNVEVGAAATAHTHVKANITDFPASLPASDVSAWAKAGTKPSYAYSEITSPPASLPASDVSAWAKAASKPTYANTEVGAAATSHTHVKANITDFPASLPASDVSAWAKAAAKPTYTNAEVGAAATAHTHVKANITDFTHTHVKANITDFPASLPASDVYAWAKSSVKPSYAYSEVGAQKPITSGTGAASGGSSGDIYIKYI